MNKTLILAISSFFTGMGLNILIIATLIGATDLQAVAGLGTIFNSFIAFGVYGELREKSNEGN